LVIASISAGNGIMVRYKGKTIVLDPSFTPSADVVFISHAHMDHVHKATGKTVTLASNETVVLAKERGCNIGETKESLPGLELMDSGHILGSKGLLIDGEIFYTGDMAGRPRGFLNSGKLVKSNILIIDSTYGTEQYRFPPIEDICDRVNRSIADCFSKGRPVLLMGYPLGKSQILTYLFSNWEPYLYFCESVRRMNEVHVKMGVDLPTDLVSYEEARERGLLEKKPWVLICPLQSGKNSFIRTLKRRYNVVTIGFTGWSVSHNYANRMSLNYAFPLSDHCDFDELVNVVKNSDANKVFTVYGHATEFAEHLRNMGFDASPLPGAQKSLGEYMKGD